MGGNGRGHDRGHMVEVCAGANLRCHSSGAVRFIFFLNIFTVWFFIQRVCFVYSGIFVYHVYLVPTEVKKKKQHQIPWNQSYQWV